jgi:hypothetical protein
MGWIIQNCCLLIQKHLFNLKFTNQNTFAVNELINSDDFTIQIKNSTKANQVSIFDII